MRSITEIIIHCSATQEGKDFTVEDITRWHKARKFRTIGYHYVIYRDGSIHTGRPLSEEGAHCKEGGHNKHSIGVCYIGGLATDGKTPKDTRTPEQKKALTSLLKELKAKFPNATIHGHREFVCNNRNHGKCPGCAMMADAASCKYANKACPSFNATREYKSMAVAILFLIASLLLSSCHTTKHVAEEQTDSSVQEAVSMSATSSATDKFLQNIVLSIDSIVITQLSVPQMSHPGDESVLITQADDNSGSQSGTKSSMDSKARKNSEYHSSNASRPSSVLPLNSTKVVISGIRLQSNTADSSSVQTVVTQNNSRQASQSSLVKAKVNKKHPNSSIWILLIIFIIVIAVAVASAITQKNPIRAAVSFILRKVLS